MKRIKIFLCFSVAIMIVTALSIFSSANEKSTAAYRYTVNGETVEAEHIDGTTDLSDIITAADAGTTVYVLCDIEMASGDTSESVLIDVKKDITVDLGGNTLSIKQNGKNYNRNY